MLFSLYIVAIVAGITVWGISLDKEVIVATVVGALALRCVGRPRREAVELLVAWIPFVLALLVYDAARAGASVLGRPVTVTAQISADRGLFGNVPTVWLQQHYFDPDRVHWWDVAATLVYCSHFIACFALAGWLWTRDRIAWLSFAVRFFVLCAAGALTFVLVPTAPPWAASQLGHIGPVVRTAAHGWSSLHLREPEVLLQQGRQLVNPYAAIPSLHAAWALLFSITLWPYVATRARPLLVAYPIAMALTLVYTGEHYVIDIVIGWCYVLCVVAFERRIRHWEGRAIQRVRKKAGFSTSIG